MTLVSLGTAAPGFPLSGAALHDDDLVVISRNLAPVRLAVIDVASWTLKRIETLDRGDGAFATTTAADGIWLTLFGAQTVGNTYRLAGGAPQLRARLDTLLPWDLASDDGDLVYGVATNPSLVWSISRSTGAASDLGVVTNVAQRPRTCVIVGDRVVFAGSVSGTAWLRHTDRAGGDGRFAVPSAIAPDDIVYCSAATGDGRVVVGTGGDGLATPAIAVFDLDQPSQAMVARLPRESLIDTVSCDGGIVYATARPSGAVYRLDTADGSLARIAVPVRRSETRETFMRGTSLLGASADGSAWTVDLTTGDIDVHSAADLGLAPGAQRPQSIVAASDVVDVGGSFSITRHDLAAGTATTQFLPGEAKAMVEVDGTRYLAIYPIAEIWEWRDGWNAPRRLTQLPNDQLRPIDLAHSDLLDALVCTTTDDRAVAALHTIDPVTGRVDTVREPMGLDQGPSGLRVAGRTAYVGGSGDTAVAAFDLRTGERTWQIDDVFPSGRFALGLELVDGHLIVSTSSGWLARIRVSDRTVVATRRFTNVAGHMGRAGNKILVATPDALVRVDPVTLATTELESGLDAQVWGWTPLAVAEDGKTYLITGRDLAVRP